MRLSHPALALCASLALAPSLAHAGDPAFNFGKKEDVKEVVWKASAQLGAAGATGNSQILTVTGGLGISRNDGWNKIALDANALYSNAWDRVVGATDANNDGTIDASERSITRTSKTAANNWMARLRYDRFFTERNSGYLSAFVGQDTIGGKSLFSGGQIGYSRLLLKSEMHELAAELGYDLSYTRYVADGSDPTLIHSARLFVGYLLTVSKETAINASVEAFINGNSVDIGPKGDFATLEDFNNKANDKSHKGFGEATRVIGKVGLTTVIYKNINFKFGVTLKFDNAPSPIELKLPATLTLANGVAQLRNDKLDVLGDAAIQVNFL